MISFLFLAHQVVHGESAIIGDARENRGTIRVDHVGMTKFSSRDNEGYKDILSAIKMLLGGLQEDEARCDTLRKKGTHLGFMS
jgi:hypothetical protein